MGWDGTEISLHGMGPGPGATSMGWDESLAGQDIPSRPGLYNIGNEN